MPLQIPNLDNKTYDELMDEIISSIPKFSENWTNFNPSDPGITILELLSYVAETLLYRINRLPYQTYVNFLRMLAGVKDDDLKSTDSDKCPNEDVDNDPPLRNVINILKKVDEAKKQQQEVPLYQLKKAAIDFITGRYRAVTEKDFVELAINVTRSHKDGEKGEIKRAVVREDQDEEDIVEIIIITDTANSDQYDTLKAKVQQFLETRKLIGTRISVKQPTYTSLKIMVLVKINIDADKDKTSKKIIESILSYLAPFKEDDDSEEWDYGRDLYVYDISNRVNKIAGVAEVTNVVFNQTPSKDKIKVKGLIDIKEIDITVNTQIKCKVN